MSVAIHFTPREREIVELLSIGKTASEMGTILGISYITVNQHISSAKIKAGVYTGPALVATALRKQLIT